MSESQKIDQYITSLFADRHDLALFNGIDNAATDGGLPPINVSASEGMLLHVLAKAIGAKRILEIGTLGGFSGTWLAQALPSDGALVSLELNDRNAAVARANFERAGVAAKVNVIVGPASDSLTSLIEKQAEPFDIVFIDADKDGYTDYLAKALKLVRKGGLILGDNTLSHGVLDGDKTSGIARYNAAVAGEPRLTTAIATTARDDFDGLSISVVG